MLQTNSDNDVGAKINQKVGERWNKPTTHLPSSKKRTLQQSQPTGLALSKDNGCVFDSNTAPYRNEWEKEIYECTQKGGSPSTKNINYPPE